MQGVREKVAGAVSAEDFAMMTASLEAIARELGWDENARMPHRGRRGFGPRHRGFGPGFGFAPAGEGFGPGFGPAGLRGFGPGFPGRRSPLGGLAPDMARTTTATTATAVTVTTTTLTVVTAGDTARARSGERAYERGFEAGFRSANRADGAAEAASGSAA